MATSLVLTLCFAAALLLGLLVKFWLASRQIRHVAAPPAQRASGHLTKTS
jgi:uncharacterized protein YneF (UPF0154 family)